MAEMTSSSMGLCQGFGPSQASLLETQGPEAIKAFVVANQASPQFDQTLACHLARLPIPRAAGVLALLDNNKSFLKKVKKELRFLVPAERWNFMVGLSAVDLNYASGTPNRFRQIPKETITPFVLLALPPAETSTEWVSYNGPVPFSYNDAAYTMKVSAALCSLQMPSCHLTVRVRYSSLKSLVKKLESERVEVLNTARRFKDMAYLLADLVVNEDMDGLKKVLANKSIPYVMDSNGSIISAVGDYPYEVNVTLHQGKISRFVVKANNLLADFDVPEAQLRFEFEPHSSVYNPEIPPVDHYPDLRMHVDIAPQEGDPSRYAYAANKSMDDFDELMEQFLQGDLAWVVYSPEDEAKGFLTE